jgi:hypothetical protein
MKKTFYFLLLTLVSFGISHAQSLSQVVVASSGATISGASNTLSFTSGEAVVGSITNGPTLGQGFWLGAIEAVVLSNEDFTFEVEATVYPNPVTDYLSISFQDMAGENFDVSVYDMNGKQVYLNKLVPSSGTEKINFYQYNSGIYLLKIVQSASNKSKTFKIIKQ